MIELLERPALTQEGRLDMSMSLAERMDRAFYRRYGKMAKVIGERGDGSPVYAIRGAGERVYAIQNSSQPSTAAPVSQPTGTAIRTMLQIEAGATHGLQVVEWGISLDGVVASNPPGKCELFTTTVAATMSTASVAADVTAYNGANDEVSSITYGGTTHTGFATAAVTEGTVVNYRMGDMQLIPPTSGWVKQWPLGREFMVATAKFIRVRVTFTVSINAFMYVMWAE